MELKEIKAVIDLMTKNGLSEFELERQDFKIRIKRNSNGDFVTAGSVPIAPTQILVPATQPPPTPVAPSPGLAPTSNTKEILSPMVGTFYLSPSPDSAPYVEVGKEVNEDTVVCIIEAMKVMNEIKAEVRGIIKEVVQENGKPVDFNKPLFRVTPL
jgi:acetyl-CoA carboxylase biotin carboxyl carrier protein